MRATSVVGSTISKIYAILFSGRAGAYESSTMAEGTGFSRMFLPPRAEDRQCAAFSY
jgi:hypothetical protein